MKQIKKSTLSMVIILSVLVLCLYAAEKNEVNKTFKPLSTVEIKTVSGDCIFKIGNTDEIKVSLVHNYSTDDFEPIMKEEGATLILEEKFKEGKKNIDGNSTWTVTIPGKTNIHFSTVSGNFTNAGLKADIHGSTVSGNIDLSDLNGKLHLEMVSGNIKIQKATGEFKVKAVSGNIHASEITLTDKSAFKCVSGNVNVNLSKTAEYDLEMKTVSGDSTLNYNGNPIKGYFSFKGQKGNINSPIPFDSPDDAGKFNPFIKNHFTKDGDSPKISMETIAGELTLKK